MCGINGIVRFSKKVMSRELSSMNKAIHHRGPDGEGFFTYTTKTYSIGLGHTRLSILDLSSRGHQPLGYNTKKDKVIYEDKKLRNADLIIVYNGEVYNYLELKNKFNLKTETKTDTEVILKLYSKLGFNCVKHFNGMWAFCIFDKKKSTLFCSRDRLGQKPLYYYFKGQEFIFSSELKGLLSVKKINTKHNINLNAIKLYFGLGFIPSPHTIYKNTFKLEPSQNLVLNLNNKRLRKWHYWRIPKYNPVYDKQKLVEKGKRLLKNAVKIRMRSDVPIGAFLSGGLDSSTVVGVMKDFTDLSKLHTFSIGFEGTYDETKHIKTVVNQFKTIHHHYYFKERDFKALINKYSWVYDEPFSDSSGFPTYKVSKIAKKFVTVVLTGDGGDEIFGGYRFHLVSRRIEYFKKMPKTFRKVLFKILNTNLLAKNSTLFLIKEGIKTSLLEDCEKFYSNLFNGDFAISKLSKEWMEEKLRYCLNKTNNNLSESIRIFDLLFRTLADNFLLKIDRASMANALEVRSPFLDYRFAEFSQNIPIEWKVDFFKTKKLMREIVRDILPKKILSRGKKGFEPPLDKWILKQEYKPVLEKGIKILKELNLYELARFYKDRAFTKNNKLYNLYKIRLFLFIKWWERWIR
ncbi:asparagine synthase (glutamine-hydrolyzing) [Candidatus Woesearchaeota archaeon]|nr:asparagine synthase (glutamine-hydrolyzing) [Candidatus Woesearchaeota archaeon]